MSVGGGRELDRPRDIGALVRDALRLMAARPLAYLTVGAAFTVPVELVVSGVGLERLTAPYERSLQPVQQTVETLAGYLLVVPLVTAACALLVAGAAASPGRAIMRALERSTQLLSVVLIAAVGVAVGLVLFIVPGVYLFVRWLFVPQAVALEDSRGALPLRRSGQLVEGRWLRTAGTMLLANLIAALPGAAVVVPAEAWAAAVDREAPALAGMIVANVVTAPFVAVVATLLFFDLKARQAAPF